MDRTRAARWRVLPALFFLAVAGRAGQAGETPRLSLEEARSYMLELINHDRAQHGLAPVRIDEVATAAAQKHAEEMAANAYLAHWDLAGKLPDQRYTEQGGTDCVAENVCLYMRYRRGYQPVRLALLPEPTFARAEIEEIEQGYINESPPDDGHRRNILDPHHTHVGLAFARAADEKSAAFTNAQEFVDRYLALDPIPQSAPVGSEVVVSGRVKSGATFRAVALARGPLPAAITPDALNTTHNYTKPRAFATYYSEPSTSLIPVIIGENGRFRVALRLSDGDQPGLYYVRIWVRGEDGRDFVASERTIMVK